jgi:hypothetical protein
MMRINEVVTKTIKPKSPEDMQAVALKQRADQAARHLKVAKQQKRLAGIRKSLSKLHTTS